jgi:hypothetical protein
MPTPLIKSLAKKHHKTTAEVEKLWDRAKRSAERAGHKDDYAYINGTVQKMLGESAFTDASNSDEFATDASPVSEDAGLKDELEAEFGSGAALGEYYDDESEQNLFPDGSNSARCTHWAEQVRKVLGSDRVRIVGYDENPEAEAASGGDHDFALVDGRYIVDGWAKEWEMSADRAVHDLEDPADAAEIGRLYGDSSGWRDIGLSEATTTDDLGYLPPTAGPSNAKSKREWEAMLKSRRQESLRFESLLCSTVYGEKR